MDAASELYANAIRVHSPISSVEEPDKRDILTHCAYILRFVDGLYRDVAIADSSEEQLNNAQISRRSHSANAIMDNYNYLKSRYYKGFAEENVIASLQRAFDWLHKHGWYEIGYEVPSIRNGKREYLFKPVTFKQLLAECENAIKDFQDFLKQQQKREKHHEKN